MGCTASRSPSSRCCVEDTVDRIFPKFDPTRSYRLVSLLFQIALQAGANAAAAQATRRFIARLPMPNLTKSGKALPALGWRNRLCLHNVFAAKQLEGQGPGARRAARPDPAGSCEGSSALAACRPDHLLNNGG